MIIIAIIIALIVGIAIGRGSIKVTKSGNLTVTQREEDGLTITKFGLEVETPVDELPHKKYIILKVIPAQESLF